MRFLNFQSEELFYGKSDTEGKNGSTGLMRVISSTTERYKGEEADDENCDSGCCGKRGSKHEERHRKPQG